MRRAALLLFALGLLAAAALPARAQLQVSVTTARSNFMLYERVDIYVTVQNNSGTDLVLDNNEGRPWLSFLVSKHNRLPVRPERDSNFNAVALKAGETKTLSVNLTPLFAFRQPGQFTAAAVVDLPGAGQIVSDAIPFNVSEGRKIWSQSRPVDMTQRIYSLIRFSPDADTTRLYLRVEEPSVNLVYANLSLGDMASYVDPDVNFDPEGNIHILQPVALSTYLYTRADPDGKVLNQEIFKTYQQVRPRLYKVNDGNVTVAGGMLENPDVPRDRLSDTTNPKRAQAVPATGTSDVGTVSAPGPATAAPAPSGTPETSTP